MRLKLLAEGRLEGTVKEQALQNPRGSKCCSAFSLLIWPKETASCAGTGAALGSPEDAGSDPSSAIDHLQDLGKSVTSVHLSSRIRKAAVWIEWLAT